MNGAKSHTRKSELQQHVIPKPIKVKRRKPKSKEEKLQEFRKELSESLKHIKADLSNDKFNRKEKYDRDSIPKILLDKSLSAKERKFKKMLWEFYKNYNVDLSNYKFNREELYDRP